MKTIKTTICTIIGTMGAVITSLFGGWTEDMVTLITVMAIDFVMGLIIAALFKKSPKSDTGTVSSKSCFKGLCKKGVILLIVLIAYRLDIMLGTDYIKTATVISFITNELISIIENAGLMGIPLPKAIQKVIEVLKDKSGDEGDKKE